MRDRIGEEFAGTIAAVVPFGVFVALDSVYVEGLVHVSELGEDYFQYDNTKHQMLGERSGQRYRLGDRLQVRLVRADLETGRIDFVLAVPAATMHAPAPKLAATPFSGAKAKSAAKPAAPPAAKPARRAKAAAADEKRAASKEHH
jgi:ribonuclease R